MAVTLLACSHELNLVAAVFHLRSAEVGIHRQVCAASELLAEGACHLNAFAHHDNVDVCRWTLQEYVAHVSAHNIALHLQRIGRLAYLAEDGGVKQLA